MSYSVRTILLAGGALAIATLSLLLSLTARTADAANQSPHGDLAIGCPSCHVTDSWRVTKPADFDHSKTEYPLEGRHQEVACTSCHRQMVFSKVGQACADCHLDPHLGELGSDCSVCHSPSSWSDRPENAELHVAAGFPLLGPHANADCESCHPSASAAEVAPAPTECSGCHLSDYQATDSPPHETTGLGTDCEQCHQPSSFSWVSTGFEHTPAFPLEDGHAGVDCSSCHQVGVPVETECYGCHEPDFVDAADPDHVAAEFSHDCTTCHATRGWIPATFDHGLTSFPLEGAHATAECASCHADGYTGTPVECFA
ncbi:MAG: hypothetical protein KC729_08310, partial [Candidatus Eisenbacteria bacterium]|nr:hypothetical protein [Candidatus Eisenbacteria bacterium]